MKEEYKWKMPEVRMPVPTQFFYTGIGIGYLANELIKHKSIIILIVFMAAFFLTAFSMEVKS